MADADMLHESLASSPYDEVVHLPIHVNRHWGRWATGVVVLACVTWIALKFALNPAIEWSVVAQYLFDPVILGGVRNTLFITVVAQSIGIVGGLVLAVGRLSSNPVLNILSGLYVWFFRGVPVLVQLIFWFNLGLVFPLLAIEIPFTDIQIVSGDANAIITPLFAVLLGLGLNEAAYMAEVIRGGILSVPKGQTEAAKSLGMSSYATMRYMVLPQALRVIVPPTSNQLIIMLKISALASIVTYPELLMASQNIYSVNLRTIELLIVASFWYIILTTVFTFGQNWLEKRLGRSLSSEVFVGRRQKRDTLARGEGEK